MNSNDLSIEDLEWHHTSFARGYVRVNTTERYPYKGKFGEGVVIYFNNPKSTNYCFVAYYVKGKTNA